VAVEGINPTLTLLALILGMSDNARDPANDPVIEIERAAGCLAPMVVGASAKQENWPDAFWDSAASVSVLPDVIDPKWAAPAAPEIENTEPTGDFALPAFDQGPDLIVRRTVPTGANVLAVDIKPDPCEAER
jgi:hypothetical protein